MTRAGGGLSSGRSSAGALAQLHFKALGEHARPSSLGVCTDPVAAPTPLACAVPPALEVHHIVSGQTGAQRSGPQGPLPKGQVASQQLVRVSCPDRFTVTQNSLEKFLWRQVPLNSEFYIQGIFTEQMGVGSYFFDFRVAQVKTPVIS